MARRALTDACLAVVQAVRALPAAPWAVACSGGADSLALAWSGRAVLYLLVMTVGNAAGGVIGPLARKVLSR